MGLLSTAMCAALSDLPCAQIAHLVGRGLPPAALVAVKGYGVLGNRDHYQGECPLGVQGMLVLG